MVLYSLYSKYFYMAKYEINIFKLFEIMSLPEIKIRCVFDDIV